MLLRSSPEGGIICITQPCHAWVSGQLARVWGNKVFGYFAPKEDVCLGAEQHDIGWLLWEKAPTLNQQTGYPHRFTEVPTAIHVELWSNAKEFALSFGRYVALLASKHGTGLYERFRAWEKSPETTQIVQDFFKREYAFQEQVIAQLLNDPVYASYATGETVNRNQKLVATWDSFSLILCHGFQGEQQIEGVPISGNEITSLTLTAKENDSRTVTVSPWPFEKNEVIVTFEGRQLHQTFTDETAMREALHNAPWVTINIILKPH